MKAKLKFNARYVLGTPGRTPLRLPEVGSSALQTRLRHAGYVEQLVERSERTLQLAQLDDALCEGTSDAGDPRELGRLGVVDVDAAGRRRSRSVPASATRRCTRAVRLACARHVDLIAVLRVCRKVDSRGICRSAQSAGELDRPRITISGAEMIESRLGDGARHVDYRVVDRGSMSATAAHPLKRRRRLRRAGGQRCDRFGEG